jgi:hypothetical protein
MFGREIEAALGWKTFLTLYFASGVLGGMVQILAALVLGGSFAGSVVGASAGAFGLVAAFAMLYPERPLMMLLFFVIPLSMRAKYLLLISGVLALVGIAFPADNVAHAAHLGGMLTGIFFIRYLIHWNWRWPAFGKSFRRSPVRKLVNVHSKKTAPWKTSVAPAEEDLPAEEFLRREVDPILDKISAHGIQSLTERERRVLEAARAKMSKR